MKKQIEQRLDQALNLNQYEEEAIRKNNPNHEIDSIVIEYEQKDIDDFLELLRTIEGRRKAYHIFYKNTEKACYFGRLIIVQDNLINISIQSKGVSISGKPIFTNYVRPYDNGVFDGKINLDKGFYDPNTEISAVHEIQIGDIQYFQSVGLIFHKIKNTDKMNHFQESSSTQTTINFLSAITKANYWSCSLGNENFVIAGAINLVYISSLCSNIDSMKVFKDYYNLRYVLNSILRYEDKSISIQEAKELLETYLQYMPLDNKTRVSFIKDKVITVADSSVIQFEKRDLVLKEEQPGLSVGKINIMTQPVNFLAQEAPIILSIGKRKDSRTLSINTNPFPDDIDTTAKYFASFPQNHILLKMKKERDLVVHIQSPYRVAPNGPAYKKDVLTKELRIAKVADMIKKEPYRQDFYCRMDNVLITTPLKLFNPSSYNELTSSISSYIKEETFAYRLTNYPEIKVFCYYILERLKNIEYNDEILPGLTIAKKDSSFLIVYRENGVLIDKLDIRAINICPTNTTNLSTKLTINPFDFLFNCPENTNQKYIIDIMKSIIYSLISFINNNTMNEEQILQIILKQTIEQNTSFFFCLKSDKSVFNLGSFYWLLKEE